MRAKVVLGILVLVPFIESRADIVGGETVKARDPVRASTIGLYEPGGGLCTASLIGKDIAVTAAHCIHPGGARPVVLFGRNLRSRRTVARPVTGVAVHPRWGMGRAAGGMDEGDIALVRFPGGLPKGYAPVRPLRSERSLKRGTVATLAGFGISDARRKTGSGVLRKTRVKIAGVRPGMPEMILDQSRGHGACHGDSGGPAFVSSRGGRVALAGVTNRSHPAGAPDDCAHQVVYTKVSAYDSWIRQGKKELRAAREGKRLRHRLKRRLGHRARLK